MDSSVSPDDLDHVSHEHGHDEEGSKMFGFIVFLLSESVIFLSFFAGYIIYKTSAVNWLPAGVSGLEVKEPSINTVVLVASSFVIFFAEKALERHDLKTYRLLLFLTMAMGGYFLYGQAVEWSQLEFGFTSGTFGGMFYLLTGFHGLHVTIGVLAILAVLWRSLTPGHYSNEKRFGIEAAEIYWHFVDVIWIILFGLLYLL
jgi:cytochrome c oxidase subunit 3